jgi:hypothetical protein
MKNIKQRHTFRLDPNFATGFADAESNFHIKIRKNKNYSTG